MDELNDAAHPKDPEKIGSNIFFLAGGEIIARLAAYFAITFIAVRLGPEQFGVVGLATTIYWYLALAVAGGINDVGAQQIAREPRKANSMAAAVIILRLALALAALILTGFLALALDKSATVKSVVFLTGLLLLPLALDTSWVFKGLQQNRPVALTLILSQVLYVVTAFLFVKGAPDVVFVPLSQLFGETAAVITLAVLFFRTGNIQIDFREGVNVVKKSIFRTSTLFMKTLMLTFDTILIGLFLGEKAIGLYNAPYRICFLLTAISNAVHSSYLPVISKPAAIETDRIKTREITERSVYLATTIAAPLVIGGMIVSGSLIEAIFGTAYAEGQNALRLLLLSVGFVFIQGAVHNLLLAYKQLKTELIIFSAAAVFNIGLNIIIIPVYGITGAAAVMVLTEFLALLAGLTVAYKIGVPLRLYIIWKPVLSSIIMGAVLYAFAIDQILFLSLLIGFLTYLLALITLGGLPTESYPLFKTGFSKVRSWHNPL